MNCHRAVWLKRDLKLLWLDIILKKTFAMSIQSAKAHVSLHFISDKADAGPYRDWLECIYIYGRVPVSLYIYSIEFRILRGGTCFRIPAEFDDSSLISENIAVESGGCCARSLPHIHISCTESKKKKEKEGVSQNVWSNSFTQGFRIIYSKRIENAEAITQWEKEMQRFGNAVGKSSNDNDTSAHVQKTPPGFSSLKWTRQLQLSSPDAHFFFFFFYSSWFFFFSFFSTRLSL